MKGCLLAGHLSLPVWWAGERKLFLPFHFTGPAMPSIRRLCKALKCRGLEHERDPWGRLLLPCPYQQPRQHARGTLCAPKQPAHGRQEGFCAPCEHRGSGLAQHMVLLRWAICSRSWNPTSGPFGGEVFGSQATASRQPDFKSLHLLMLTM